MTADDGAVLFSHNTASVLQNLRVNHVMTIFTLDHSLSRCAMQQEIHGMTVGSVAAHNITSDILLFCEHSQRLFHIRTVLSDGLICRYGLHSNSFSLACRGCDGDVY